MHSSLVGPPPPIFLCADYFSNVVFLLNSSTGVITMNPNLPMFDQNLNFESRDPNPFVLRVRLLGECLTFIGCGVKKGVRLLWW